MVGWTALALAKKAVVPIFTLEWIEGDGKITNSDRKALAAIQETLGGGIEFLSGEAPGVRLHSKKRPSRDPQSWQRRVVVLDNAPG